MYIEKLVSFAQEPQRVFAGHEIFLPCVSKGKPSLTPTNKQQIQMFFEAGQRPAYRRSRELEIGGRGAERSRLCNSNEYSDVIKIGRFAHAQPQFCSTDHSPGGAISGTRENSPFRRFTATWRPWAPRTRISIGKRPFRLNSRILGKQESTARDYLVGQSGKRGSDHGSKDSAVLRQSPFLGPFMVHYLLPRVANRGLGSHPCRVVSSCHGRGRICQLSSDHRRKFWALNRTWHTPKSLPIVVLALCPPDERLQPVPVQARVRVRKHPPGRLGGERLRGLQTS